MDSEQFDLVFSGDLIRGADLQQSKFNLARLFKIPESKVDALFSGKPIVLKKGLDFATASKYRVAIKKAGCRVDLVEKVTESAVPLANSTVSEPDEHVYKRIEGGGHIDDRLHDQQRASTKPQGAQALPLPEVRGEQQVNQNSEAEDVAAFQLAPVGADVLAPGEKSEFAPLDIDTSKLVLRESGADLLDESERAAEPLGTVSELQADIAPVGSDLLAEIEPPHTEVLELDLSGLSLSEPGTDLGEIREEKPVKVPDISHLSVE